MKSLVLLSTDTLHHRYFINHLKSKGYVFKAIIFETTSVVPSFETKPFFNEEEDEYEKNHFFQDISDDISNENIFTVENINNSDALEILESYKPDLGIVFGTRKLTQQVISCFADGLLNIHRGIAQEYRGLDSDLWAIYHNDIKNIGVTIHKVDTKLDTGAIVYQSSVDLNKGAEIFHIRYITTLKATELVIDSLRDYFEGKLILHEQTNEGRYYSFMPLSIKRTLLKKFRKLVDGK